jgi:hypothetical protein
MEPLNIMFTLNKGKTRWIYVMGDSNASPVKITIKYGSCLLFSNFKVHGGMVFKPQFDNEKPQWRPAFHA